MSTMYVAIGTEMARPRQQGLSKALTGAAMDASLFGDCACAAQGRSRQHCVGALTGLRSNRMQWHKDRAKSKSDKPCCCRNVLIE